MKRGMIEAEDQIESCLKIPPNIEKPFKMRAHKNKLDLFRIPTLERLWEEYWWIIRDHLVLKIRKISCLECPIVIYQCLRVPTHHMNLVKYRHLIKRQYRMKVLGIATLRADQLWLNQRGTLSILDILTNSLRLLITRKGHLTQQLHFLRAVRFLKELNPLFLWWADPKTILTLLQLFRTY